MLWCILLCFQYYEWIQIHRALGVDDFPYKMCDVCNEAIVDKPIFNHSIAWNDNKQIITQIVIFTDIELLMCKPVIIASAYDLFVFVSRVLLCWI